MVHGASADAAALGNAIVDASLLARCDVLMLSKISTFGDVVRALLPQRVPVYAWEECHRWYGRVGMAVPGWLEFPSGKMKKLRP